MQSLPRQALPQLHSKVRAEKSKRSFREFVRQGWHIVEPAMPFVDNWHVGAVCEHLEAVKREEIRKLLINIPPGHAKSLLVSVFWPAWMWIEMPWWRSLFSSYASELAIRDSVKCRMLLESSWYKDSFLACDVCASGSFEKHDCRSWELSGDQNVKSYFRNTKTGERLSISVGSKATGFRGNAVVVDDPLNVIDAPSKLKRDEVIYWWDRAMSSRLNDKRRGAFVIIMQRLHEEDLAGHVKDKGGYEHLFLPSEYESSRKSITFITKHESTCELRQETPEDLEPSTYSPETDDDTDDCIAEEDGSALTVKCSCPRHKFWEDPRVREGELLFKRLFPKPVLAEAKVDLGSEGYAGQHQQRPAPEDGEKFKKGWWRFWKPDGTCADVGKRPKGCYDGPARPLPAMHRVIISLDAAFKDGNANDWVVFQVWGCHGADRFLLDQSRAHRSFTACLTEFTRLTELWPDARKKIVEDKANGPAIIDTLKSQISGIVAVNPEGGKEVRAAAVQPQVESGNVYLPDGAPWLDEFVAEFVAFPRGKHDDQVDALSQALLDLWSSIATSRARGMASM